MEKAKSEWIGEIQHKTLLLKSLSAQDVGIYKCKIYFLEYSAFEAANIDVKGNNHYFFINYSFNYFPVLLFTVREFCPDVNTTTMHHPPCEEF